MGRLYKPSTTCQVPLCLLPVRAKWLCNAHYQRKLKGDPNWKRPVRRRRSECVWVGHFRMWPEVYEKAKKYADNLGMKLDDGVCRALEAFFHARESELDEAQRFARGEKGNA